MKNTLFAPAWKYVFDVAGDDDRPDVDRHQFDFFWLWLAENKKHWLRNPVHPDHRIRSNVIA
jgi:hypothetical protein